MSSIAALIAAHRDADAAGEVSRAQDLNAPVDEEGRTVSSHALACADLGVPQRAYIHQSPSCASQNTCG
jgi:hypothetical protein